MDQALSTEMRVVGLRATNVGDGLHVRLEWAITGTSTFDYSVVEAYDRYKQRWVPFDGFNGVVQRQKTAIDDNPPQSIVVAARQPLPGTASFRVCARRRVGDTIISTPWEQVAVDVFVDLVTGDRIADGSITGSKIAQGTITGDHIRAGSIKAEHLDAVSIIVDQLEAGSITAEYIAADAIEAHHIKSEAIEARHIKAGAINADHIQAGSIQAGHLAAGIITADSAIIADAAIKTAQIQDAAITSAKIAEASIMTAHIQDAAITTAKIADAAITEAKIGIGAITAAKIGDAQITTAHIRDAAITSAKIADAAITTAKIEDAAITTAKIGDLQVTNAKIAAGLDASKITTGYLSADVIEAGSITADKLTIGDFSNLVPNPAFRTGDASDWEGLETILPADDESVPVGAYGAYVARIPVGTEPVSFYASNWIDTEPGEKYFVSIQAVSTEDANGDFTVGVVARRVDGTETFVPVATKAAPGPEWSVVLGEAAVPEGHHQIRFWASVAGNESPAGAWFVTMARFRKKYGGTLIEEGSISSEHIKAHSITADHIEASVFEAINARIDNLDAGSIKTGILDADRVTINASAGGAGVGLQLNSAGITLTQDGNKIVRLDASGIRISNDGGETWSTKLDGAGLRVSGADIGEAQIRTAHIAELDAGVIKSGVLDSRLVTIGSPATGLPDFEGSDFRMELGPNGLIIRDTDLVTDTTRMIWLSSEGLKISSDGGQTWSTKLTGDGLSVTTADLSEVKITSAMIEEAAIRDAHIYDVSADKLRAGTINTGTITVKSTLQVTDQDDQVRVVLGDISSIYDNPPGTNYGVVLADPEKGILIDAEGVHTEGILDAAIVTEKLAPEAVTDEKIRDVSADKITVGTLDANRVTIAAQAGGVGNRFIIDRLGMTVQNADLGSETDKTKMIRIDSDGLKVSRDGGRTWVTKITGDGLQVTSADIGEAQITSAHILELDASLIKSGYIDAARIAAASITADKLVIGKIPHAINPATDHLFHFDTDVASTQGLEPIAAVATLRPGEGRFGGAVAVEEGTTNLVAGHDILIYNHDPNQWEMTLTTLSETFMGKPIVRITLKPLTDVARDHVRSEYWGHSCRHSPGITFNANTTYTATIYWRCLKPSVQVQGSPSNIPGWGDYRTEEVGSGWKRSYAKWYDTTTRTDSGGKFWGIRDPLINTGETIAIDFVAPQIEAKPFATSFVDGTRAAGRLSYPVNFNMDEGTIHVWFYFNGTTAWNTLRGTIFRTKQGSGGLRNHFWLFTSTESGQNSLRFQVRRDDGSVPISEYIKDFSDISDGWHSAVVRWSTSAQSLDVFLDGQLLTSYTYPIDGLLPFDAIDVGCRDTTDQSNTLIDELLILPYAASEEEIRSWYVMDAPFYDPSRVIMGTTIADGAITARHIRAQSITGDHIRAGAITAESGIIASLNADVITGGTLNVGELRAIVSPFGGDDAHPRFRLDSSGLQIQDSTGQKMIRLDDDGLKLSTDGGQTWDLRITGDGIVVDWADIRNVNITHAQIQSIDATKITVNKIKGSQIEANSITSSHIQAGAIKADQLDASGLIAKISSIQQAFINDAHITSLRADKISGGYLNASVIRAGSITGTHLAANSITTDKLAVGSKANLVNNFSMTGTLTGWSGYGSGTLVDEVTKGGVTVKTLKITTTGDVQVQSEVFEVDPTKTYEVTLSIYSNHPDNAGTRYFGLHCYDANMNNIGAIPFTISSRTFGSSPNTNPYFWSGDVYGGQWRDMTAYILGCNVDASEVPLGKNVTYHYKMLPNTKYARIRFLNYYNEGVSVTNHFFSPSVSLAPATLISADSISTGTLLASKVQILSGSATGNRIVLDGAGLRAYGSEGETVNISSSDGNVYLRGSIRANQFILPVRAT